MIQYFLNLNLITQLLLGYLLVINLITFFYFGIDKLEAKLEHERTPEKILWILCLFGGSLGGLLGMNFFRHKTKKLSFQTILAIILTIQIWIIYLIIK